MWLNTTEKDPHKFQAEVENVCRTYLSESLVTFVAGRCGVPEALGEKAHARS